MKQGRMVLALGAALVLTSASIAAQAASKSGAQPAAAAAPTAASRNAVRQFTGYVTALDRTSLTVEKRGKNPRSMVFAKDASLPMSDAIEKDARVTVYYREQDGHAVAQRVVAKVPTPRTPKPSGAGH
ncbi:MAG TPA: hypothetical protein VI792_02700 [Candidatus Eisenbacteria bacterium]